MKELYSLFLKRIFDIIGAIILIIILSPLLILISFSIKLSSDGPVLFKQERLGKNSIPFYIYKFRSMKTSAPNVPSSNINGSEYVTKLGEFLRKTSLDEMPQLFNIITGDMSFIGPRPFIPHEGIIIELRKQYGIDKLRPGLTGWAQVIARETCDQYYKCELELFYLKNISPQMDLKTIYMTFYSLRGK